MTLAKKTSEFNPRAFLSTIGKGREMLSLNKKKTIFAQGDATQGLFFIQKGKVQLTVVSEGGKEATLGILGEGDFFGEGSLGDQPLRMSSATAATDCVLLHVEKQAMMRTLSLEPKLSALFVKYLLKRNIRYQDDLIDQLFNSSEKRLARVLLLMAHFGQEGVSEMSIPRLSQETLAEMVGTTRSRVSFFMNRFRKLGFINYNGNDDVKVRSSLLNIILQDDDKSPRTAATHKRGSRVREKAQAPVAPGAPEDEDRAKRPSLSAA